MDINPETGLLATAEYIESPNQDARPADMPIDLCVLHNISLPPGQFGGQEIIDLFCNRLDSMDLEVSAHLLIRRGGELVQFVPFHRRAWHAGVSHFAGRDRCNDFSIGIELEGTDDLAYTEEQYAQVIAVIRQLQQAYPQITIDRITGHSDIAPGRKTDPGPAFDWPRLRKGLTS